MSSNIPSIASYPLHRSKLTPYLDLSTSDICKRQSQWSDAMGDYRAYILGIDGNRFVWVKDFSTYHPSDAAALKAAKRLTDTHDVEVWDGGRLVARLSPSREEASPGLVPPVAFALSSDGETNPVSRAEPDPVSRVLDLVTCILRE
jgi:hypothetical protein